MNQPTQPKKRPTGVTVIAVLWALGSIYNLARGLIGIAFDMRAMRLLSSPYMGWFRFGLPTDIVLNFFMALAAFLSLLTVYGLSTGRSWSYYATTAFTVFISLIYIFTTVLYASAPPDVVSIMASTGFSVELHIATNAVLFFVSIIWAAITRVYIARSDVKQYLNRITTPPPAAVPVPPAQPPLLVPPPTEHVAPTKQKKFCRYCGAEQRLEAIFCNKCGKKIA